MAKDKARKRNPSRDRPRAFLSILPICLFWPEDDEAEPLIGLFRRLPPRAVALFAYLASRMDMDTGRVRGELATWGRPEEHGRDPKTLRTALRELEGAGLVEWGDDDDGRRALFAGEAYWIERCRIRGARNKHEGGRSAWVQHRDTIMRGGPWQALTDSARVLWLFMRALAPREARKTDKGVPENENEISQSKIKRRTGLSERCITDGLRLLELAGLVDVRRLRRSDHSGRYLVNVYSVAAELARRVCGRFVDFSKGLAAQLRGAFPGRPREQHAALAAWWWRELGRSGDPPARLRRLLPA